MKTLRSFIAITVCLGFTLIFVNAASPIRWEKHILTDKYYCDGINCGDFNRDGQMDIVAGPFWWFQLTRQPDKSVRYTPHQIDDHSGVGCQVVAADVTGDGRPDILTVSKLGVFLFINHAEKP